MNREELVARIRKRAKQDERRRRDYRFLDTMGLLTAKGFLKTNMPIALRPNKRLRLDDAIWAGEHVEPRILEVLPAAVLRLERHFQWDPVKHKDLARTLERLRTREKEGEMYRGVPYAKVRAWADLPLRDRRVKAAGEKKVPRTYRLDPRAVEVLRETARKRGTSETAVLEKLILDSAPKTTLTKSSG